MNIATCFISFVSINIMDKKYRLILRRNVPSKEFRSHLIEYFIIFFIGDDGEHAIILKEFRGKKNCSKNLFHSHLKCQLSFLNSDFLQCKPFRIR